MESFFFFENEVGETQDEPPPLATHCDVPLTYAKQRAALNCPEVGQVVKRHNKSRIEFDEIQDLIVGSKIDYLDLATLQYDLINKLTITDHPVCLSEFQQQHRVATEILSLQKEAVGCSYSKLIPFSPLSTEELSLHSPLYNVRCFWEEAVLSSGSSHFVPKKWWKKSVDRNITVYEREGTRFVCTPNLFYGYFQGKSFLVSRDHLLILHDIISQRFMIFLGCDLATKNKLSSVPPKKLISLIISIQDQMLKIGGNDAYDLVYSFEASCSSRLVGTIPVLASSTDTFKDVVHKSNLDKAKVLGCEELFNQREEIVDLLFKLSPDWLSQTYGLYRIWGHPTIHPLRGVSAVKKLVTTIKHGDPKMAELISNKFKEELIMRWRNKHKTWPELDVSKLSPVNCIRKSYEGNHNFPLKSKYYNRKHLSLIRFKKNFPVDPKFDLLELLADKAISLDLAALFNEIYTRQGTGSSLARSVLIEWMKSSMHDPEEFLNNIDKYGFPKLESCFGVREKEREGKLLARLFGLMTIQKRMYVVLTEALLAEHIIPYFPEITMMDDEILLDKKRLAFTGKKEGISFLTSLDFSKWNSNMREPDTRRVFESFDDLFGFQHCFTRTHQMFNTSTGYLLNGNFTPRINEDHTLKLDIGTWRGHLGGIEGLRQKGWTIWTIILILVSAENLPMKLSLMGQGDNQLLRSDYPEDLSYDEALKWHYKFINSLEGILSKIGPPLKVEETWTSTDFYLYGKYPIYKGAPLSMSLKKFCKMTRFANEDFPTLESALSSLSANMTSAISSDHTIDWIYYSYLVEVVGCFQAGLLHPFLQHHSLRDSLYTSPSCLLANQYGRLEPTSVPNILGQSPLLSDMIYKGLLITPRCLGGYPISTLPAVMVKGFPDEVSLAIAGLKKMMPIASPEMKKVITRILSPILSKNLNYTLLLEHPSSLNLDISSAPSESRRGLILEFMQSYSGVRNPYLREFLTIGGTDSGKKLVEYLTSEPVLYPRILQLFYSATAEYRARQVVNKMQKTKTIGRLAASEGGVRLNHQIRMAEINHFKSVIRMIFLSSNRPSYWNLNDCSLDYTQKLRELGWKKLVEGIHCVPPQEFMDIELLNHTEVCSQVDQRFELDKGYITASIVQHQNPFELQDPLLRGPYKPYRGSSTRQKIEGIGGKLSKHADPILKKVLALTSVAGWAYMKNGNLDILAKTLLAARTDLPYESVIPTEDQMTGSHHHRLSNDRTEHGGTTSVLPNQGTKITFDTSTLVAYCKGSKNVNLMFQPLLVTGVTIGGILLLISPESIPLKAFHIHVRRSCCVRDISETAIEVTKIPPEGIIHCNSQSPYLFCPKQKLEQYTTVLLRHLPTKDLSMDLSEVTSRFYNLLGEECIKLLSPATWKRPVFENTLGQLSINWALRADIVHIIKAISVRLIGSTSFYNRALGQKALIEACCSWIHFSSSIQWKPLENLAFCPDFHHQLIGSKMLDQLPGDPSFSHSIMTTILAKTIERYIRSLEDFSVWKKEFMELRLCCSPSCPPSFSPTAIVRGLLMLQKSYIDPEFRAKISLRSYYIDNAHIRNISSTSIPVELRSCILNSVVSSESLDNLSKKALFPQLIKVLSTPVGKTNLPNAASKILVLRLPSLSLRTFSLTSISATPQNRMSHSKPIISNLYGKPTSAPYKLLSVLNHLNLPDPTSVSCLADGAGGFTYVMLKRFPSSKVFYNTLVDKTNIIEQFPSVPFIPFLAAHPDLEKRVIGLVATSTLPTDITSLEFPEMIKTWVRSSFEGGCGDAESQLSLDTLPSINLFIGYRRFCESLSLQWFIAKTYMINLEILQIQLSLMLGYFEQCTIYRSRFSAENNREIYIYFETPKVVSNFYSNVNLSNMMSLEVISGVVMDRIKEQWEQSTSRLLPVDRDVIQEYASYLSSPDYCDQDLNSIQDILPWVSRTSSIKFPCSLLAYYHSICKENYTADVYRRGDARQNAFTPRLVLSMSMSWLIIYGLCHPMNHNRIITCINTCSWVWYRLTNERWGYTIIDNAILERFSSTQNLLFRPLFQLITPYLSKIIHRSIVCLGDAGLECSPKEECSITAFPEFVAQKKSSEILNENLAQLAKGLWVAGDVNSLPQGHFLSKPSLIMQQLLHQKRSIHSISHELSNKWKKVLKNKKSPFRIT